MNPSTCIFDRSPEQKIRDALFKRLFDPDEEDSVELLRHHVEDEQLDMKSNILYGNVVGEPIPVILMLECSNQSRLKERMEFIVDVHPRLFVPRKVECHSKPDYGRGKIYPIDIHVDYQVLRWQTIDVVHVWRRDGVKIPMSYINQIIDYAPERAVAAAWLFTDQVVNQSMSDGVPDSRRVADLFIAAHANVKLFRVLRKYFEYFIPTLSSEAQLIILQQFGHTLRVDSSNRARWVKFVLGLAFNRTNDIKEYFLSLYISTSHPTVRKEIEASTMIDRDTLKLAKAKFSMGDSSYAERQSFLQNYRKRHP